MKKLISITLTLLLLLFVNNAMAQRDSRGSNHDGYSSRGERVEQRLDARGDRIERRFDQKAAHAAEQGRYRQARHFQKKGDQIDRHLDRKGKRIHARFDQHINHQQKHKHQHGHTYQRVASPINGYRHNNFVSVMIRQPGLWLGWGTRY